MLKDNEKGVHGLYLRGSRVRANLRVLYDARLVLQLRHRVISTGVFGCIFRGHMHLRHFTIKSLQLNCNVGPPLSHMRRTQLKYGCNFRVQPDYHLRAQ